MTTNATPLASPTHLVRSTRNRRIRITRQLTQARAQLASAERALRLGWSCGIHDESVEAAATHWRGVVVTCEAALAEIGGAS